MTKRKLPSFGIQRGLKVRLQSFLRDRLANYATTSVLETLYTRDPSSAGKAVWFPDTRQEDSNGTDAGLPIPPDRLLTSWNDDVPTWLATGREHAAVIKDAVARHGGSFAQGGRALEWGCAAGRVLRHFAPEAQRAEVWGIDVHESAVRWSRANLSPPFLFATVTQLPHLPFSDAAFNVVWGVSVMTHIEHLEDMWLLELRRILRPGGLLLLTIHDEATLDHIAEHGAAGALGLPGHLEEARRREVCVVRGADWRFCYTFFKRSWVEREWGRWFEVLEHREMAVGFQALVVMAKPAGQ